MKTVFDKATREELIYRIGMLNENSKAAWGKMNVYQMMKHCTLWEEWVSSKTRHKQAFIGRLFGKIALKQVLKDDAPLSHNTPTLPELMVTGNGDVAAEKKKWAGLIERYADFSKNDFVHTFFGKMTNEQIGQMAYKHNDHHLRQFNC